MRTIVFDANAIARISEETAKDTRGAGSVYWTRPRSNNGVLAVSGLGNGASFGGFSGQRHLIFFYTPRLQDVLTRHESRCHKATAHNPRTGLVEEVQHHENDLLWEQRAQQLCGLLAKDIKI
jgi:hypothetical protein